jgi:hypothetical protein
MEVPRYAAAPGAYRRGPGLGNAFGQFVLGAVGDAAGLGGGQRCLDGGRPPSIARCITHMAEHINGSRPSRCKVAAAVEVPLGL